MPLKNELTLPERRVLQNRTSSEPICDYPGCQNVAVQVVGIVRDINSTFVVCAEHANPEVQPSKIKN